MNKMDKVVWKDGTFLYPQHFQRQDSHYEELLKNHHIIQPFENWGIIEIDIDESYFKLNKIVITKCVGVFPDGTFFSMPNKDELPIALEIPDDYDNKLVYLGLPLCNKCCLKKPENLKSVYNRYYPEEREIDDIHSEGGVKSITVGKLNINLFLEGEYTDQIILIPILKVLYSSNGISIDPRYIPPFLRVKASNVLQGYLNEILGVLNQYIKMNEHLIGEGVVNQSVSRVENALILQTVSSYKYLLSLMSKDNFLTPQFLMEKITSLIGALIVFTKDCFSNSNNINYNHTNLIESFEPLVNLLKIIFKELNTYISVQVVLKIKENNIYEADLSNLASLEHFTLIMGVEFEDIASYNANNNILNSIKISDMSNIKHIISLQVSGLGFSLINVLPSYVVYNDRTLYLRIEKNGKFWEEIEQNRNIALYLNEKINKIVSIKLWMIPNEQNNAETK